MENASKALLIAGGVLLSVMVVSLLIYTSRSFGNIARAEEAEKLAENKLAFNAEYEIYDKSLMYGTDVLSCLNKAQSNNQKYVNNNYFSVDNLGSETRMEYLIDVEVKLKSTIIETVRVYRLNQSGKKVQTVTGDIVSSTVKPFRTSSGTNFFNVPNNVVWYYFENGRVKKETGSYGETLWANANSVKNSSLVSKTYDTKLVAGTYNLFTNGNTDDGKIGKLSALLSTAGTLVEQTIVNNNYSGSTTDWYSATWRTAAYDFKTRKFKCTGIEYSEETGYVSKVKFEEL